MCFTNGKTNSGRQMVRAAGPLATWRNPGYSIFYIMKLKIKHFQSWKDAEFEFAPFSVIVGPSNSGKTAIVRAIEAALFNTSGDQYITRGKKLCNVFLSLPESDIIKYVKGASAKYEINGANFSAIGRGPFEKVDELGYKEITADKMKIRPQISRQHDAPFLISGSYTPTAVGAVLNDLSESSQAQQAKRMVEKDVKTLSSKIKHTTDDLQDTHEKMNKKNDTWNETTDTYKLALDRHNITKKLVEVQSSAEDVMLKLRGIKKELESVREVKTEVANFLGDMDIELEIESKLLAKKCVQEDAEEVITTLTILKDLIYNLKVLIDHIFNKLKTLPFFLSEIEEKKRTLEMTYDLQELKEERDSLKKSQLSYLESINQEKDKLGEFDNCPLCGAER